MKNRKRTLIILCVALSCCLVSMVFSSLIQSNWGRNDVSDHLKSLAEIGQMIRDNNAVTGRDIQIHFTEDPSAKMHYLLLVPNNATAANPAPGIVSAHGGDNVLEVQLPFYIELARRGYVVLSMDMAGHGRTDNAVLGLTSDSYGMLAVTEYLMSLPFVDPTQIGLTGHSMGNLCSVETIKVLNKTGSTQRIRAWVEGDGTLYTMDLTPEMSEGLIMSMNCGKFSEFDVLYTGAYDFMNGPLAKSLVTIFYPGFEGGTIPEGQWYTADGAVDAPASGQRLEAEAALNIYNAPVTHPGWHFSLDGTRIAIDGFYAAFGTPQGATTIDSGNQVWPVAVAFSLLGLIGFFALLFPLTELLIATPLFAGIKRPVPERDTLPSFKEPRQWIPSVATLVILVLFAWFSYIKLYPIAESLFDKNTFPSSIGNAIGFWTMISGLFLLLMIGVSWLAKRPFYKKDELTQPYASACLSGVSQFLRTLLFAVTVIALMYIPVVIAHVVFHTDFRICTLAVQTGDVERLYVTILRYAPMWCLFYVSSAIFNAGTRWRDVPEWASTLLCAVANCVALIVFVIIQYSTIENFGVVPYPNMLMGGIVAFSLAPVLGFSAFSARYVYKKTGNAWAAGLLNGLLMCLLCVYGFWWYVDLVFVV